MKFLITLTIATLAALALLIVIALNVEPTISDGQTEPVEFGNSYRNGSLGLKLNDVQCLNMITGQIEICY